MKFWTFLRHRIIEYSFNFYFVCYFKLLHVILFSKFLGGGGGGGGVGGESQDAPPPPPPLYETLVLIFRWSTLFFIKNG